MFLRRLLLILAVVYTAALSYFSLRARDGLPALFPHFDKLIHFLAYLVLALLWASYIAMLTAKNLSFSKLLIAGSATLIYGTIIEIFQEKLTETRVFDFMDILANGLGIFCGLLFFSLYFEGVLNKFWIYVNGRTTIVESKESRVEKL